ncbi:MAG: hypothetical protein ABL907_17405 [Hyphomicrobium sp.]
MLNTPYATALVVIGTTLFTSTSSKLAREAVGAVQNRRRKAGGLMAETALLHCGATNRAALLNRPANQQICPSEAAPQHVDLDVFYSVLRMSHPHGKDFLKRLLTPGLRCCLNSLVGGQRLLRRPFGA